MTSAHHLDQDNTRNVCQQALQRLVENTLDVTTAILMQADGSAIAFAPSDADPAGRLKRLAVQLYPLSEGIVAQAGIQASPHVFIETANGRVLLFSVPGKAEDLLLCVVTGPQVIPAHLLWSTRNCCDTIQRALCSQPTEFCS